MTEFDLRQDGVTMVAYNEELRAAVAEAACTWDVFCELPLTTKQRFAMTEAYPGVGYESKDGAGPQGDRKENFDITLGGCEQLMALLQPDDEVARRFLTAASKLAGLITPMVVELGDQIETRYHIDGFASLAERSAAGAFFRFLHYPQAAHVGDLMAEAHDDNSGLTFHLRETHEGCERLGFDGVWRPLPAAGERAVAFGGMQLQLVSRGELHALVHRVIANELSVKAGRQAIVCFIGLNGVPQYDKRSHGRLQELPGMAEGITYTMPQNEFAKLFKL